MIRRDLESINYYSEALKAGLSHEHAWGCILQKGRDNARTPMQWNTERNAGFSVGEPWINVNPNYKYINAEESRKRENSVFNYYKKLIQLRKENDIIVYGDYSPLYLEHDKFAAFRREYNGEKWVVFANFSRDDVAVDFV